jgi:hypothetical protein
MRGGWREVVVWSRRRERRRLRLRGILSHHGHDGQTARNVLGGMYRRAKQLGGRSLSGPDSEDWVYGDGGPSTAPQHSFTKTGWCLCLRGIVACLLRLTCLFNRD